MKKDNELSNSFKNEAWEECDKALESLIKDATIHNICEVSSVIRNYLGHLTRIQG